MSQCTVCLALFHTLKNAKAHLCHSAKCLHRVSVIAERKRRETGIFLPIDSIGIIGVSFTSSTRSNFVGGIGFVSREGRELVNDVQVINNILYNTI